MGQEYVVSTEPVKGNTYDNKGESGGQLVVWRLGLDGIQSAAPDGLFEVHKKPDNLPPPKGQRVVFKSSAEGDHEGVAFTRLYGLAPADGQQQRRGGGSSNNSRGSGEGPGLRWQSKPYQSSAEHPRNEARTIHTVGVGAAPAILEQWWTIGIAPQPKDQAEYWEQFGAVVKVVRDSYRGPLERASGAAPAQPAAQQPEPAQAPGGDVPADAADLPAAQPVAAAAPSGGNSDDDIPF